MVHAPSGVTPEEGFIVQHTGQFMIKGFVKFPEKVSGGWKHRTQVPVCCPPGVREGPSGERCLPLLRHRACREDNRDLNNTDVKVR